MRKDTEKLKVCLDNIKAHYPKGYDELVEVITEMYNARIRQLIISNNFDDIRYLQGQLFVLSKLLNIFNVDWSEHSK